jgi:hypothetical protein
MGTALLLSIMQLNFNEADFLMHCMELFCVDLGTGTPASFTDDEGKQMVMDHEQINALFLRLQEVKFLND